nr:MAG TPA: hypothetical protein [Crassvirales sp.]
MSVTSCSKKPLSQYDKNNIVKVVEEHNNPVMSSYDEVLNFQNIIKENYKIDEQFRSMPSDILENVVTVCLNKQTTVTKKEIVAEYLANSQVYDNLKPGGRERKDPPSVKDSIDLE